MSDFEQQITSILMRELPGFDHLLKAERLSGGASQETYRLEMVVGGQETLLAMRRSPGGQTVEPAPGHPGLAVEALLMQTARIAEVPEPGIVYVLNQEDGLGDGFIMDWLDGITLGAKVVRSPELDEVRPELARLCGQALARIHAIDLESTGLSSHLDILTPTEYVEQTWNRYRDYGTPQPMIDFTARWLLDNLPGDYTPALVHNDFRNGNIMFDETGIVAVLDWEVAHIGDPARDLGWICTNSWRFGRSDLPVGGFGLYEDLFQGYESVSGKPVDPLTVRWWEIFGSFWWAIGCLGMAEHYRTGPDKTVERPAIGRRSSECQVDCVNLLIPGPVEIVQTIEGVALHEMPSTEELMTSVRDFLREEVMSATQGRVNFLARVAGNSLDIVIRELVLGPKCKALETDLLRSMLGVDAELNELKWNLTWGLRDGSVPLELPGLANYLRFAVVNQAGIDQPNYSGFKTAVG